jgi:hypothetical protein
MSQWEVRPLNAFAVAPTNIMDGISGARRSRRAIAYRIYAGEAHGTASRRACADQ